MSSIYIMAIKS